MDVDSVIAIIRKGAKKLAPLLFQKKHQYYNGEKFIGLYIEEDYCCFVIAQAQTNPNKIVFLAAYKDILLLEQIHFAEGQTINNKELIDVENLYYLEEINKFSGSNFASRYTQELIANILQKVNYIEFANAKTNESLYVQKGVHPDVVEIKILKTEFDTLMLTLDTHALVDIDDDYIWLKSVMCASLINILYARRNDVIIEESLQRSE